MDMNAADPTDRSPSSEAPAEASVPEPSPEAPAEAGPQAPAAAAPDAPAAAQPEPAWVAVRPAAHAGTRADPPAAAEVDVPTMPKPEPPAGSGRDSTRPVALALSVVALAASLAAVWAVVFRPNLPFLDGSVTARLAAAESALSRGDERIAAVQRRVDALTPSAMIDRVNAQVLLAVSMSLRGALQGPQPFAAELAAVQAVARDDQDIRPLLAPLAEAARTGIPTAATLRDRFAAVEADILGNAVAVVGADSAWLRQGIVLASAATAWVGWVPDADLETARDVVARARDRLAIGHVAGAVEALEQLTGASAQAAAPWLAEARARVAADAAMARIPAIALRRLGGV